VERGSTSRTGEKRVVARGSDDRLARVVACRTADSTAYCSRREQIDQCWFDSPAESFLSIPVNFGMNAPITPGGAMAGGVLPIRRAEELIATLPGVLSVRIVPSDAGAIDEVHVLTTDVVAPKQTVRNIESALIAQFGFRVNHRKISIATTLDPNRANEVPVAAKVATTEFVSPVAASAEPGATRDISSAAGTSAAAGGGGTGLSGASATMTARGGVVELTPSESRLLLFQDVEVRRSRERGLICRVTLTRGERAVAGEARGQASERARIDLAARATVTAIMEALGSSSLRSRSLALEGSQVVAAFDREFIFVSVSARDGRDTVTLTGSCEVQESAETSSVLAVLNATNRWMQLDR